MLFNAKIRACDLAINVVCDMHSFQFVTPTNTSQASSPGVICPMNVVSTTYAPIPVTPSCGNNGTTTTATITTTASSTTYQSVPGLANNISSSDNSNTTTGLMSNGTLLNANTTIACNSSVSSGISIDDHDLSNALVNNFKNVFDEFKNNLGELKMQMQEIIRDYLTRLNLVQLEQSKEEREQQMIKKIGMMMN